jgi:hypothetical protein
LSVILLKPDTSSLGSSIWAASSSYSGSAATYPDPTVQLASLSAQVASLSSWVSLLNNTGSMQTVTSAGNPASTIRGAWVINSAMQAITITTTGTYLIVGTARLGSMATTDNYWLAALYQNSAQLTVALGGYTPPNGPVSAGDHTCTTHWTGTLLVGDVITMQVSELRDRGEFCLTRICALPWLLAVPI